jgi:hypothetical protein
MELLPPNIRRLLIERYPIRSQDGQGDNAKVIVKLFFPTGRYTLYVTEGEPYGGGDMQLFGYCVSPLGADCDEWGYSCLSELEGCVVRGLRMERDITIEPEKYTVRELRMREPK